MTMSVASTRPVPGADMPALVYTAPGRVEVQVVPTPTPATDEVLIDVRVSGICGSETHGVRVRDPFRVPPLIMGHEFAGNRSDTGERVVVNPLLSCGHCPDCRAGRENLCTERSLIGVHRPGGFARWAAVPVSALHALPDHMSWDSAALIEPLANVVHGWRLLGEKPHGRVAVIGAGAIGLMTTAVATLCSPDVEVTVVDRVERRLAVAQLLGAAVVGSELTGQFDVVVDAVGSGETRRAGLDSLRPGGTSLWFGLHDDNPGFDALRLVRQEQRVIGSFAYGGDDFAAAIELAPEVDATWLDFVPVADSARTFMGLTDGSCDAVKAVVDFSASSSETSD